MYDNWFSHSLFIEGDHKSVVTKWLENYTSTVNSYMDALQIEDTNVYIGGSLSRGEPSITVDEDGSPILFSDVDLLAVIRGGLSEGHPISHLESFLNQSFPRVSTSVFCVSWENFCKMRSLIGRDFLHSASSPIARRFDGIPSIQLGHATRQDKFEVFIHQLSIYIARETGLDGSEIHVRESRQTHELKLALEALRLLVDPQHPGPLRYGEVANPAHQFALSTVRSEIDPYDLIKSREVYSPKILEALDIANIVSASLRSFESKPGKMFSDGEVADRFCTRIRNANDFTSLFQDLTVVLFFFFKRGFIENIEVLNSVATAVANLERFPMSMHFRSSVNFEGFSRIAHIRNSSQATTLIGDLYRTLRKNYYMSLRRHMFGHGVAYVRAE
ncbi:hypothetical protein [Streptomyces decoyicus]|uniref:hypothetical protein n=1 Tax=Streptomyces decoyicus TaxID=249567 RepID=UPI003824EC6D